MYTVCAVRRTISTQKGRAPAPCSPAPTPPHPVPPRHVPRALCPATTDHWRATIRPNGSSDAYSRRVWVIVLNFGGILKLLISCIMILFRSYCWNPFGGAIPRVHASKKVAQIQRWRQGVTTVFLLEIRKSDLQLGWEAFPWPDSRCSDRQPLVFHGLCMDSSPFFLLPHSNRTRKVRPLEALSLLLTASYVENLQWN